MTGWRFFGVAMLFAGILAWAGSSLPVEAQDKKDGGGETKFEFKAFSKGAPTLYQIQETKTNQVMKVMNQEVIQKQDQTFYISWTPETSDKGDLVVVQKIIAVKLNIDIGGNRIAFDSTNEEHQKQTNPMTDFFNALKSLELKFTIDPATMTIKSVDGGKKLIDKLAESTPPMKSLLNNILSDDAIKQMAEPAWGAVPLKAVKKGDEWKKESKLSLGAIGSYDTVFNYKLEGTDEKNKDIEKIKVTPTLTYKAPDSKAGGLPFVIKSGDLKSDKESSGTVLFDKKEGRITSSTITMKLEGKLVIEVGNTETTVDMVQTQTSTATFSTTNPVPSTTKKQ